MAAKKKTAKRQTTTLKKATKKKAKKKKAKAKKPAKAKKKAPAKVRVTRIKTKVGTKKSTKKTPKYRAAAKSAKAVGSRPLARAGRARASAEGTVSVRMYRGLLGDFFLVKHTMGQQVFKMLVDCGVLQLIGTKVKKPTTALGKERIQAGVTDLMADTGGELDLVVATHEHYDHLSGFILANTAFKPLKIGKLWVAWTEDRSDKLANGYRKKKNKALNALVALAQSDSFAATDEMSTVSNLLQFYGGIDSAEDDAMGVAKRVGDNLPGNASCETIIEWLKRKAGAANVSYLKPGQALPWGVGGVFRAYVLGPPRDDAALRKLNPAKGAQREVYLARGEDVETVSGLAAIHGDRAGHARLQDQPFARLHWRPYVSKTQAKGQARKTRLIDPVVKLYERAADASRAIDSEWLGSAEDLALKIDGDVNNTSLVLALELAGKEVLLFAADAQVGNWLSWGDQTYPSGDGRDAAALKVDELLARTIFYKVGHHASHNATLRERGLELMTDARLCAMIPVVEKTAHEQKNKNAPKGWKMPFDDLYARLEQRTGGRILRGDGDVADETAAFKKSVFNLNYGPNVKAKDPLWVELALEL